MAASASKPGLQLVQEQVQGMKLGFALGLGLGWGPNLAFVLRLGNVLVRVQELPPVFELRLREWFGLVQGFLLELELTFGVEGSELQWVL